MSNIDKQALRNAAKIATPGPWYVHDKPCEDGNYGIDTSDKEFLAEAVVWWGFARQSIWREEDAKFIAAANPATVLALLDELEAKDKQIAELKALAPELKMAHLINKFYERYPLAEFKSDTDRSAALGYFMAGAELQCFGEFVNYAELMGDE